MSSTQTAQPSFLIEHSILRTSAPRQLEQMMKAYGLSARRLALDIDVSQMRISRILAGAEITADTAIRLGHYFGVDPRYWLNMQTDHALEQAMLELRNTGVELAAMPKAPAIEHKRPPRNNLRRKRA